MKEIRFYMGLMITNQNVGSTSFAIIKIVWNLGKFWFALKKDNKKIKK